MKKTTFFVFVAFFASASFVLAGSFVIPEGSKLRVVVDQTLISKRKDPGIYNTTVDGRPITVTVHGVSGGCITGEVINQNGSFCPVSVCAQPQKQRSTYHQQPAVQQGGYYQNTRRTVQQQVVYTPPRVVTRQVKYPHATVTPLHVDPNAVRYMTDQQARNEVGLWSQWNHTSMGNEQVRRFAQQTDHTDDRHNAKMRRYESRTNTEYISDNIYNAREAVQLFRDIRDYRNGW